MDNDNKFNISSYYIYIIPSLIFLIALLILFTILPTQFSVLSETRQKIESEKQEISKLDKSINIIKNLSDEELSKELSIAKSALPEVKDILAMYSGVSQAATRVNVSIDKFSVSQIGKIYGTDKSKESVDKGTPFVALSLTCSSDNINNFQEFINELYKVFPIAEIKETGIGLDGTKIDIVSYYKPFDPKALSKGEVNSYISAKDKELLKELEENWTFQNNDNLISQ